jgi:hypothetical protein
MKHKEDNTRAISTVLVTDSLIFQQLCHGWLLLRIAQQQDLGQEWSFPQTLSMLSFVWTMTLYPQYKRDFFSIHTTFHWLK